MNYNFDIVDDKIMDDDSIDQSIEKSRDKPIEVKQELNFEKIDEINDFNK